MRTVHTPAILQYTNILDLLQIRTAWLWGRGEWKIYATKNKAQNQLLAENTQGLIKTKQTKPRPVASAAPLDSSVPTPAVSSLNNAKPLMRYSSPNDTMSALSRSQQKTLAVNYLENENKTMFYLAEAIHTILLIRHIIQ